jgi:hypothetical protein
MAKLTAIEWDIISARVHASVSQHRLNTVSMGFLYLVLDQFFPGRPAELAEIVTDGSNDRGVDAIEIIEKDEEADVYVFQAKYRESADTTDKTINEGEIHKILSFLHELFDKSENLRRSDNLRLRESVCRVWDAHDRGVLCRYHVVLCSNDQGISPSARNILEAGIKNLPNVTYEAYGPLELLSDIGARGRQRETGYLQVIGKEAFERTDGDIRGIVASVDARSFVTLIQNESGSSVKRHLFEDNLRVFLGKNGGYNSDIISTATSDDSHLFWYLNNGITITCQNYSYNKGHVNPKIRIEGFQIVNGAQTSHSLLEAARISPSAIENVVLSVRIYATDRHDIAERVAVATNSQARIQNRDLRANNPVLRKLELAMLDRGYYFERKRNMHSDRDAARRIDALKLGQIIQSYYLREPERARADSDSIFGSQFGLIFNEHYDVDELCRLFELYSDIEKMRDAYLSKNDGAIDPSSSEHYLVFGHWFILYACQLLNKPRQPVPTKDNARSLIVNAINLVARACGQTKPVSHYQMFRSPKTKEKILAELDVKQLNLFNPLPASSNV